MAMPGMGPSRLAIEYGQGETLIGLPMRGGPVRALGIALLLAFWSLGGLFAVALMAAGSISTVFFTAWITGWAAGFIALLIWLFWTLVGRETLVAVPTGLTRVRSILFFKTAQAFSAPEARQIAYLADDPARRVRFNGRRIPQSALVISGSGRTVRFAHGIGQAEAEEVVAAVRMRVVQQGRNA